MNLAINARDATPDGGVITIGARAALVDAESPSRTSMSPKASTRF